MLLADFGPEVGQQHGAEGAGPQRAEVQNPNAAQRPGAAAR
jgi:hypothetical protein